VKEHQCPVLLVCSSYLVMNNYIVIMHFNASFSDLQCISEKLDVQTYS